MRLRTSCLTLALLTACASSKADTSTPSAVPLEPTAAAFDAQVLRATVEANVPVLPRGLTSFGAVEHDGILYVLGGYSGTPHAY